MRLFHLAIIFNLLLSLWATFPISVSAECIIITTLRLGSRGAEVECLQGKVGAVQDGNFGPMTKFAVMSFQARNSLVADGIVGHLSRGVLNATNNGVYPAGCTGTIGYSPTTGAKCDGGSSLSASNSPADSASTPLISNDDNKLDSSQKSAGSANNTQDINPNLANLDQLIETVVEVNRKSGSSEKELDLMTDAIRETVLSSNVDYNKKFEELLVKESKLSANLKTEPSLSIFDKIVNKTFSFFGITPSVAQAAVGVPFGARLIAAVPCIGSWMITTTPFPPTGVVLLSYIPGTQGFATYNIPFTRSLVGVYIPAGICSYSLVNIKTQGTIAPMVGSSPF